MAASTLPELLSRTAAEYPDHVAIEEPGAGAIRYRELQTLAERCAAQLHQLGVRPGDRVGVCLPKSIDAVAGILGILRAGGAYVPIDPTAPAARGAAILHDCGVRAILVTEALGEPLRGELAALGTRPAELRLPETGAGLGLEHGLADAAPPSGGQQAPVTPADLAYILYTSGSTGKPKGVMLTHRNALSFVHWCSETFQPSPTDRFSSHAPFHFDLSILDLYLPLKHGATLVLIDSDTGRSPLALAKLIAEQRISVWYSTPSILSMLRQYGRLERHDWSALRLVLFAGEVFPVKHLRDVWQAWPAPRYFNLYGPTETNVCTYHEVVGPIPEDRNDPYPIGAACGHARTRVVDETGADIRQGDQGELVVAGAGVMAGYWNRPEPTAAAFLTDPAGERWYRTGDIVVESASGEYQFIGRRDRMVKRRGYRIELGEIEAALYRHPAVREIAAVATANRDGQVAITVCLCLHSGATPLSTVELKRFSASVLPGYMVPDNFVTLAELPKTSTDKLDYERIRSSL